MTANAFPDEAKVAQFLKDNAPKEGSVSKKGIYYIPYKAEDYKPGEPSALINLVPDAYSDSTGKLMAIGFGLQILSASLVLLLLRRTKKLSYKKKVLFVALLGLIIGFVSQAPLWNWFGFPLPYVTVQILDSLIAWSLAGLVMAKFAD